ncbi:MAG TPA: type II toxin-antitoxin system RelE/ParE family toxin [Gemmatimonadales bacterium]|nr:type II toxin-antitoxin system RelE/ParE family toxin [Gemmatimonadales bacterium]
MQPRLSLEPEAEADLSEAFSWYEDQHPGLGSEFLAEVARVLELIEQAPGRYPIIRGQMRRALVRRFPYAIFYVIDPDLIAVTAVMHGRRDPRRWQTRDKR